MLYLALTLFYSVSYASRDGSVRMNFTPSGGGGSGFTGGGGFSFGTFPGSCGIGGRGFFCGIGTGIEAQDADRTPFYQGETLINGVWYWHTIVGDPRSGFAMESYTRRALATSFGSFSGGAPPNFGSLGLEELSGNGWDPLGLNSSNRGVGFTGNGSADPTKTLIRQVMGDGEWNAQTSTWSCGSGEFCSEFLKNRLNTKPIISQIINDSTPDGALIQSRFILDMSDLTYTNSSATGILTNTLTLTNPSDSEFNLVDGNFDMATDTQEGKSIVTGGRYTYRGCSNPDFEGSCWRSFSIAGLTSRYDVGSYTYVDGTNDVMAYDWGAFFDPTQNTFSGGGAGSGNQDKCTKTGEGRPNSCNGGFGFGGGFGGGFF